MQRVVKPTISMTVVLDVPHGFGSLEEVEAIMSEPIDWAPGLPMGADGFESDYYKKD